MLQKFDVQFLSVEISAKVEQVHFELTLDFAECGVGANIGGPREAVFPDMNTPSAGMSVTTPVIFAVGKPIVRPRRAPVVTVPRRE